MMDKNQDDTDTPLKLSLFHHPYAILGFAIFLPGMGQVLNSTPGRGLLMVFFMLMLGIITFNTTTPDHSFLGRFSGGLFIYSISIIDAYRWGRYRWEYLKHKVVNPD